MTQALTGAEARGGAATNDRPYKQTYGFDAFGHLTQQNTNHWTASFSSTDVYSNNRRTGWNYDADGRLLADNDQNYTYDAAGQMITAGADSITTQSFDGDGGRVKTVESAGTTSTTTYYVRSSVLSGQVLTELTSAGAKQRTFVYSGSQVLAWQESPFGTPRVMWEHRDPSDASFRMSDINGSTSTGTDQEQPAELDPLGADSGTSNPYLIDPNPPSDNTSLLPYPSFSDPRHPGTTYTFNGIRVPADFFMMQLDINTQGEFGIAEAMRKSTLDDNNYYKRWRGPASDGKWVTTAIPLYPSFMGLFGFAALPPQNPLTTKQMSKTTDGLSRAAELAAKRRCNDFINRLLQRAAEVIQAKWWLDPNRYASTDGVFLGVDVESALSLYGKALGNGQVTAKLQKGAKSTGIVYGETTSTGVRWYDEFFDLDRDERGLHSLHEALHQLKGFDDQTLANAARWVDSRGQYYTDYSTRTDPVGDASRDLNGFLRNYCAP